MNNPSGDFPTRSSSTPSKNLREAYMHQWLQHYHVGLSGMDMLEGNHVGTPLFSPSCPGFHLHRAGGRTPGPAVGQGLGMMAEGDEDRTRRWRTGFPLQLWYGTSPCISNKQSIVLYKQLIIFAHIASCMETFNMSWTEQLFGEPAICLTLAPCGVALIICVIHLLNLTFQAGDAPEWMTGLDDMMDWNRNASCLKCKGCTYHWEWDVVAAGSSYFCSRSRIRLLNFPVFVIKESMNFLRASLVCQVKID